MKISVIVPCYNVEKYIDECLKSILNQTIGLDHLEIILVDDCSTDNTVSRLKWYEQNYSENIILILRNENGKQGTARNIGLEYASGDYISFVDADDCIHTEMYEILNKIIEETNSDIVQFGFSETCDFKPIGKNEDWEYRVYDFESIEKRRAMLLEPGIFNESCTRKIYRLSMVKDANVRYAEGVAYEEPLFTYPLKFFANRVSVISKGLYYYRYNAEGTTVSYMKDVSKMLEHLQVQMEVYDFVRAHDFYKIYKDEIDLYFIHSYFCEQFYFLKYRGVYIPQVLFKYSAKEFESKLPEWKSNPYLVRSEMKEERTLLDLIDRTRNMPEDDFVKLI